MLDELLAKLKDLPEANVVRIREETRRATAHMKWIPTPGPQTEEYLCEADILLYGGQAGGGKTDLLLGLAFNEHQRALILRRQYNDFEWLLERTTQIHGSKNGLRSTSPIKLNRGLGRVINFRAAEKTDIQGGAMGQPHDFIGLDEAAQLTYEQFIFFVGWLRTTKPGQRTRVVLASNPPLTEEGEWMIRMFGAWLDPNHHNPAKPGELRWYITAEDGKDTEVSGPGEHAMGDKKYRALSRTFIPAGLKDNPYITDEYRSRLDALPEPLRSAVRDGNFQASRRDDLMQCIPTAWIRAAQERWKPEPPKGIPMCAVGVDVAQGGMDKTTLAMRYNHWFAPIVSVPGAKTPEGRDVAALVLKHRRDRSDVIIDMGGGYGGATMEHLQANNIEPLHAYKGSEQTGAAAKDSKLRFFNRRAEVYWRFREALDPSQRGGSEIALPHSQTLLADLASIRLDSVDMRGIKLEPKKKLIKRIGRSTDESDAVVMAWSKGPTMATHAKEWASPEMGLHGKKRPTVVMGHPNIRRNSRR